MENEPKVEWTIPFSVYMERKGGTSVFILNDERKLQILDDSGVVVADLLFAKRIKLPVTKRQLEENDDPVFFVYEDGYMGKDWLWCYQDLLSVEDLF